MNDEDEVVESLPEQAPEQGAEQGPEQGAEPCQEGDEGLGEEQVTAWLARHPDFFARHPGLLPQALQSGGKVIELEAGRLEHLRRQNQEIQQQLDQVVERIHRNEEIHNAFHALQLKFVAAADWESLVLEAATALERDFQLPRVTVALTGGEGGVWPADRTWPSAQLTGRFYVVENWELEGMLGNPPKSLIRVGREGINRALFFGEATYRVRSELLVPLMAGERLLGSLNLGGELPSRFMPSLGTELVENMAAYLALCLHKLLP